MGGNLPFWSFGFPVETRLAGLLLHNNLDTA
jgi:hypothetical protein